MSEETPERRRDRLLTLLVVTVGLGFSSVALVLSAGLDVEAGVLSLVPAAVAVVGGVAFDVVRGEPEPSERELEEGTRA